MANANDPPRRISMSYLLGLSSKPFKNSKAPAAPQPTKASGVNQLMSTPGGIVAWAASDGRRPKMVDGVRKALDKEAGKNSTPGHKRNENKDTSTKSDNKGGNGKQNDEGNQKDCGGGATTNGDNNQQSNDSSGWTEEQDSELIAFRKEHPKGQWTCAEKMGKTTGECGKRFGELKKLEKGNGGTDAGNKKNGKGRKNESKNDQKDGSGNNTNKKSTKKDESKSSTENDEGGLWGVMDGFDVAGDDQNENSADHNNTTTGNLGNNNRDNFNQNTGANVKSGTATGGGTNDLWASSNGNAAAGPNEQKAWDDNPGGGGTGDGWNNQSWDNQEGDKTQEKGKKKSRKSNETNKSDKKDKQNDSWASTGNAGANGGFGDTWVTTEKGKDSNANNNGGWADGNGATGGAGDGWGGDNNWSGDADGGWGAQGDGNNTQTNDWGAQDNGKSGRSGKKDEQATQWNTTNNNNAGADTWNGGDWANDNAQDASQDKTKSSGKAPSKSGSNRSRHHKHDRDRSRSRTPTKRNQPSSTTIELKPDDIFSADDLRLIARILQQDCNELWRRVSFRFQDKTGRRIMPEVFEKKITGVVEAGEKEKEKDRERDERKSRRK